MIDSDSEVYTVLGMYWNSLPYSNSFSSDNFCSPSPGTKLYWISGVCAASGHFSAARRCAAGDPTITLGRAAAWDVPVLEFRTISTAQLRSSLQSIARSRSCIGIQYNFTADLP